MTVLILIATVFVIIWEILDGRIPLNFMLLLLVNFVSGFRLELMHIFLIINIRSSLTYLPAACAAVIFYRNHFCLYQRGKSSESKVRFTQGSNRCKRVFKAAKLAYSNKEKEFITSQKLGSLDFWRILIVFQKS